MAEKEPHSFFFFFFNVDHEVVFGSVKGLTQQEEVTRGRGPGPAGVGGRVTLEKTQRKREAGFWPQIASPQGLSHDPFLLSSFISFISSESPVTELNLACVRTFRE